jgi:hypothetical protein
MNGEHMNGGDFVAEILSPKAFSLTTDAPRTEAAPDTVDTLRARLAVVVDTAKADADAAAIDSKALADGGRLAAAVLGVLAERMGARLDAHAYDFGHCYGEAARERVRETTDRLRGRVSIGDAEAVALVDWLLPATWREALVEQVREELVDSVREHVAQEIRDEIEDEIRDEVRDEIRDTLSSVGSLIDEIETAASTIRDEVEGI